MNEWMLNEGEISAIYEKATKDASRTLDYYLMKAQAEKLVEYIEKNTRNYGDRKIETLLNSTFWRSLKKEVGL